MGLRNMTYNKELPPDFCEGKMIPYLVPGVYEFFSAATGFFLVIIGVAGMVQPHLELLLRLMYSGIASSGIGTVLLHYKRTLLFNFADVYPLLITLSIGLIALFDEIVFEFRRPRAPDGLLVPWKDHSDAERTNWERALFDAFAFIGSMMYMVIGLCLVIFAPQIPWDAVGVYFGATFALTAFGGMFFFSKFRPDPIPANQKHLTGLRNVAAAAGVVGIMFKLIDSFACSPQVVWIFPHAFFHVLTTYATHCFIVFMAFYRANNKLIEGDPQPEIIWKCKIYPYIKTPDVPDIDERHLSVKRRKTTHNLKVAGASITPRANENSNQFNISPSPHP